MRTRVLLLAAAVAAAGIWLTRSGATRPLAYSPVIDAPAWPTGGPAVLIDDAHWNHGAGEAQLAPLAALLRADGYQVLPDGNATRAEMLEDAKVAVIVNPQGLLGAARQVVAPLGLADLAFFDDDGLLSQEIETTLQWIDNGGSLLLAVDPAPLARGSRGLATRLGVTLGERPIIDAGGTRGQALEVAPQATILQAFGPSARETSRPDASAPEGPSAAGRPWAVALERGRGRIVVLGTSESLAWKADGTAGVADADTERFVRDVLRWLSRRDTARSTPQ